MIAGQFIYTAALFAESIRTIHREHFRHASSNEEMGVKEWANLEKIVRNFHVPDYFDTGQLRDVFRESTELLKSIDCLDIDPVTLVPTYYDPPPLVPVEDKEARTADGAVEVTQPPSKKPKTSRSQGRKKSSKPRHKSREELIEDARVSFLRALTAWWRGQLESETPE
jgi:hypothetical protein